MRTTRWWGDNKVEYTHVPGDCALNTNKHKQPNRTNTKPSLTTSSKSVQPSAFLSMTDSTPKDSNKRAASRTGRPTESSSSRRATGSSRPRNAIDSSRSRSASIGHVKVDNRRECRGDRRGNPLPLVAAPVVTCCCSLTLNYLYTSANNDV